jgi:hypothetical protein
MSDPNLLPVLYQPQVINHFQPEQVLVTIGDIAVTQSSVIVPHGRFPLRATAWTVQDSSQVSESTSSAGVVLAVLSVLLAFGLAIFTCGISLFLLLGLLFLMIKDRNVSGFVAVSVVGPGLFHSVQLPPGQEIAAMATFQVNQARALAAAA